MLDVCIVSIVMHLLRLQDKKNHNSHTAFDEKIHWIIVIAAKKKKTCEQKQMIKTGTKSRTLDITQKSTK